MWGTPSLLRESDWLMWSWAQSLTVPPSGTLCTSISGYLKMLPPESEDVTGTKWTDTKVLLISIRPSGSLSTLCGLLCLLQNRGILGQDVEGEAMSEKHLQGVSRSR